MQIHAGIYKGRRIKTVKNAPYRPTTAIVRKSLFDILGIIENKTFLDLFSGTGIIGFEAVSRGASFVAMIDSSVRACGLLKINHSLLKMDNKLCEIKKMDVFKYLEEKKKFDIIFADPPYNTKNHDQIISVSTQLLNQGGYFILESSPKEFSILPSRIKQYGDTQLAFWRYEE